MGDPPPDKQRPAGTKLTTALLHSGKNAVGKSIGDDGKDGQHRETYSFVESFLSVDILQLHLHLGHLADAFYPKPTYKEYIC